MLIHILHTTILHIIYYYCYFTKHYKDIQIPYFTDMTKLYG